MVINLTDTQTIVILTALEMKNFMLNKHGFQNLLLSLRSISAITSPISYTRNEKEI